MEQQYARIVPTAVGDVEAAVFGSGPAVVIVHGTLGSWRQTRALGSALARDHTIVLVSRPGYGATPIVTGRTFAQQGAAHGAVLDSLGIAKAALIGVSAGAPSCVDFASSRPDRCSQLVLCGPLAPHLASTRGMWATGIPGVVRIWRTIDRIRLRRALRRADVIGYLQSELSEAERVRAHDEDVAASLLEFMTSTAEAPSGVVGLQNDIRNIRASHRGPPAKVTVRAPTLILHGNEDRFVPIEHGRYYERTIPGAQLHGVRGGAHLFLQTFADDAMSTIRTFLRQTAPNAGPA